MPPISEKLKVLHLIRKEKNHYSEIAKMYGKNEFSIFEIVKNEKKFMLGLLSHLRLQNLRPQCMVIAQLRWKGTAFVQDILRKIWTAFT